MAKDNSDFAWKQVAPGLWERSADEIEKFYATVVKLYEGTGRMFFAMTGFVSLRIEVPKHTKLHIYERQVDEALQKAWLTLRYEHPTLGAMVVLDPNSSMGWTKQYCQFEDEAAKEAWLKETFIFIANGQTGAEFANSDPPAPSIPTLFVVQPPESGKAAAETQTIRRDLVFRSPHDIIDGIGTLIMLNNLITTASKAFDQGDLFDLPVFDGSEAANLSPSYRIAANVPAELSPAQKERFQSVLAQKKEDESGTNVKVLTIPYTHGAVVPGRHQRVALNLSKEQTTQLLKACKIAGATPTHLFHAAAAIAARDIQERPEEAQTLRYVSYILRNERASCSEPYSTAKHPAAVYHSVSGPSLIVDLKLPSVNNNPSEPKNKQEFRSVFDTIRKFYHDVRTDEEHAIFTPYLWGVRSPPVPGFSETIPVPPPNEQPSVSISSMGVVDSIISPTSGVFQVNDAWVTGEELKNGFGLFLATFKGELCVSAAYNDAWHTEKKVLDYLNRCKDVVFQGLDITSS